MRKQNRFAFVLPRYFSGLIGGAERLCGNLAEKLHQRGDYVEILSTCAKDNRTWSNELAPGEDTVDGMLIRRFLVDERDLDVWVPLQINISDGIRPSIEDQFAWMSNSVNSSKLYEYIKLRQNSFDYFFFAPYLFGTTFWGSLIAPKKSILVPCLHNEHYAYLEIIASMFRQVRGCLFNSMPEAELAYSLYGDIAGGEVGMGFEQVNEQLAPYFETQFPYIIYAGRKELGKNVQLLLDYFLRIKQSSPWARELKLVILGGGSFSDLQRPEASKHVDIIDLENLSEIDKRRLIKHALYLCQPSVNESFSIVLMEAWNLSVPVVVHANCPVTRAHVVESGGGLYFANFEDFVGATQELFSNVELRTKLAEAGKTYTATKYNWSTVIARFDGVLSQLSLSDKPGQELQG